MNKSNLYLTLLALSSALPLACSYAAQTPLPTSHQRGDVKTIIINDVQFKVASYFQFFIWENLPQDIIYEREPLITFTNTLGDTHYYEVVYIATGNLNWFQAAYLADDAGGYLASITSQAENEFIFNQVNNTKYFCNFQNI